MEGKEPGKVQNESRKNKLKHNLNYRLIKRTNPKFPQSKNHVLVNRKTNIQHQVNKCHELFQSGEVEVVIHGLGAAISTAINVALIFVEQSTLRVSFNAETSTVNEIRDYIPLTDDLEPFTTRKQCSAIHINISRYNTSEWCDSESS